MMPSNQRDQGTTPNFRHIAQANFKRMVHFLNDTAIGPFKGTDEGFGHLCAIGSDNKRMWDKGGKRTQWERKGDDD